MRETLLQQYFHFVQGLIAKFNEVRIQHIHREHNARVDMCSCLATATKKGLYWSVVYETLVKPNVGSEECMATNTLSNWMTPIKQFLIDGTCETRSEKMMKQQVAQFLLIDQDLYRRGYTRPLLKCLTPKQATYLLREIHEGVCDTHSGARMMAVRV